MKFFIAICVLALAGSSSATLSRRRQSHESGTCAKGNVQGNADTGANANVRVNGGSDSFGLSPKLTNSANLAWYRNGQQGSGSSLSGFYDRNQASRNYDNSGSSSFDKHGNGQSASSSRVNVGLGSDSGSVSLGGRGNRGIGIGKQGTSSGGNGINLGLGDGQGRSQSGISFGSSGNGRGGSVGAQGGQGSSNSGLSFGFGSGQGSNGNAGALIGSSNAGNSGAGVNIGLSGSQGVAQSGSGTVNANVGINGGRGPASVGAKSSSEMTNTGNLNAYQNDLDRSRSSGSGFFDDNQSSRGYDNSGSSSNNENDRYNRQFGFGGLDVSSSDRSSGSNYRNNGFDTSASQKGGYNFDNGQLRTSQAGINSGFFNQAKNNAEAFANQY